MKNITKKIASINEFNKSILSALPFGISITDEGGKIIYFNDFFSDRKKCLDCPLKKPAEIGQTAVTETLNCFDGRSYEITRTGMLLQNKKVYLEIFIDISKRKHSEEILRASEEKFSAERTRTEDELQRSETKFRTIFQNSPVGIARFDSQGVITDCNDSYIHIIGSPKEKNVGFNLLKDTKNKQYKEAVEKALNGNVGYFEGAYTAVTSNKKLVLKVEFGPIILSGGAIDGGIQIVEDITEHEATKQKLKAHTNKLERLANDLRKFELAVESASDAIVIVNPDGKIVYANRTAGAMTGRNQKEMIGKGISIWGRLVDNKDYTTTIPFEKAWKTIKETKEYYAGELININKNGTAFITELHLAPVFDKEKNIIYFVATARDITKLKEVDRAKTEFVSLASHQLRTPLAGISLASELLMRHASSHTEKQRNEYLEEIFNSTKKMSALINDLLNVSRIEMGTFNIKSEELDIAKATNTILDNLKSQFNEKKLSIGCDFEDNLPIIYFDKNAFNLIIDNLLTNAIRYTPEKGNISVNIKYKKKTIIIEVSDTGCGIPPDESDKIFSKQFRATNAKDVAPEGEGLGLYIVKLVADKLGVKVSFKNNSDGSGTTFYVSIPAKIQVSNL